MSKVSICYFALLLCLKTPLSTRPRDIRRSAAAGLQHMASVSVFTDVVTVSCSHQHKRVLRRVNCGAWEDLIFIIIIKAIDSAVEHHDVE